MVQSFPIKLYLVLLISIVGIALIHLIPTIQIKDRDLFIAPPAQIEHFVFGYSDVTADIFWVRTIQDIDYCENKDEIGRCKGSPWVYPMMDAITRLSPKYRIIYAAGGSVLSIIINDIEGGRLLFEKGVKEFPNDWQIAYRAAYHYLYEVEDKKRAAELFIQAGKNGAPPWVYSLAQRLYTAAGYKEVGVALLNDLEKQGFDEKLLDRMRERIMSKTNSNKADSEVMPSQ